MLKLILQSLAIIAVNIVVGALIRFAFSVYYFKRDPILAAIPALMALPGILLQPWFVLFFFTDALPIASIQTSVISVPLYFVLDRMGKLNRAKCIVARAKNRKAVAIIAGIFLCMLAVGFGRYFDFPALRHGVPGSSALKHSLKDMDLALGSSRHYCIRSFIDSEWLWRVSLSEQDMNLLADKMNMHPMPADQVGEAFRKMRPYWWQPEVSDQTRIMATTYFPMEGGGSDSYNALAIWNPKDNVLHMWIKDYF